MTLKATRPHVPETQARPATNGQTLPAARLDLRYDTTPPTTDQQVADVIDTWRDHGWTD